MRQAEQKNKYYLIVPSSPTLPCYLLCAVFFLIVGVLPLLPGSFTQILRPLFIVSCFFPTFKQFYKQHMGSKMQIVYLVYLGIILLAYDLTKSSCRDYVSMLLFGLFFVLAAQIVWSKQEIRLILKTVAVAGLFCSVVLLIYNPELKTFSHDSTLSFFSAIKNRNTMAFSITPAVICSAIMLVFSEKGRISIRRLFYLAALLVSAFVVIASGARSASLSMMAGLFLVGWERAREGRTAEDRLWLKLGFVLLSIFILWCLIKLTDGTNSARIFKDLNVEDNNGREDLWAFAWDLIRQRPIFGGGFDYWINMNGDSLGTHNTFLTVMVVSGYVGAGILVAFLACICIELWSTRNLIPFAFIAELLCHTYSESTMDYYAYFPLVLAYILFSYIKYQNRDISSIFKTY